MIQKHRRFLGTSLIALIIIAILIVLPTGYEDALLYQGTIRAVGKVVQVDNSTIKGSGLIQSGEQMCTLLIEDGPLSGREVESVNFLSGSLEKDKIFVPGDRAYVTISESNGQILSAVITDHYRLSARSLCRKKRPAVALFVCNYRFNDLESAGSRLFKRDEPRLGRHGHHCTADGHYYSVCLWV